MVQLNVQVQESEMKVYVVGAGYWGSKIVRTLTEMNHTVTVIDIRNGDTVDSITTNDPVVLATPVQDHFETAKAILLKGNDLYIEKPITETAQEARHLKSLVGPDQVLMSGLIFLYHPLVKLMNTQIDQGIIGDVLHVESDRMNFGLYQTKISPLLSLAPHDVSILNFLLGTPDTVQAIGCSVNNEHQPDNVTCFMTYGDVSCKLNLSLYHPEKIRKMTVIGTKGSFVYDDVQNTLTRYDGELKDGKLHAYGVDKHHGGTDESPLQLELQHFIDCCKTKCTCISGIDTSIEVQIVLDQLQSSLPRT